MKLKALKEAKSSSPQLPRTSPRTNASLKTSPKTSPRASLKSPKKTSRSKKLKSRSKSKKSKSTSQSSVASGLAKGLAKGLAGGLVGLRLDRLADPAVATQFEDWITVHGTERLSRECAHSGACSDVPARLSARRPTDAYAVLSLQDEAGIPCIFVVPPPGDKATADALSQTEALVAFVKPRATLTASALRNLLVGEPRALVSAPGVARGGGFFVAQLPVQARPFQRGVELWASAMPLPAPALWSWTLQLVHAVHAVDVAVREATQAPASTRFCWDAHTSLQLILPNEPAAVSFASVLSDAFFDSSVPEDARLNYLKCVTASPSAGVCRINNHLVALPNLPSLPELRVPDTYGRVAIAGLWGTATEHGVGEGCSSAQLEVLHWACSALLSAASASLVRAQADAIAHRDDEKKNAFAKVTETAYQQWQTAASALLATASINWLSATAAFADAAREARFDESVFRPDAALRAFRAIATASRAEARLWRAEHRLEWKQAEEFMRAHEARERAARLGDAEAKKKRFEALEKKVAQQRRAEEDAKQLRWFTDQARSELEAELRAQNGVYYTGPDGAYYIGPRFMTQEGRVTRAEFERQVRIWAEHLYKTKYADAKYAPLVAAQARGADKMRKQQEQDALFQRMKHIQKIQNMGDDAERDLDEL